MIELFILGSLWWYLVSGTFVIWAFFLTEKESLAWTIISLFLYLAFLQFLGRVNVFGYLFFQPINTVLYILGYFVIGFIWSFIKWWLRVNETAQKCLEEMDKFIKEHTSKENFQSAVPLEFQKSERSGKTLRDEWESHIQYKDELKKPIASKNKEKISVWVVYWPFSVVWSLINDFIKRMVEQLVIRFQKIYQSISNRAFKKIEAQISDQSAEKKSITASKRHEDGNKDE